MALNFHSDPAGAEWIVAGQPRSSIGTTLLLGPPGFETYARVLSLPDPQRPSQSEDEIDEVAMREAPTEQEVVRATTEALSAITGSGERLRFLLWDGYPCEPALPSGTRVDLAGWRTCALAAGTLTDWTSWSESGAQRWFPPAFVWPPDREWCLAYDVDAHFAGVAGTLSTVDELLIRSRHPAMVASRGRPLPIYD